MGVGLMNAKSRRFWSATGLVLVTSLGLAGCLGRFGDDASKPSASQTASSNDFGISTFTGKADSELSRAEILAELKALKAELEGRKANIRSELAAAKAELARRQASGTADADTKNLTPSQLRNSQLAELQALRAELARRKEAREAKKLALDSALEENDSTYKTISECFLAKDDFRRAFTGRSDVTLIVDERDSRVYRNDDRTLLLQTSSEKCDVSFVATSLEDYFDGLKHVLEKDGAIINESKDLVGIKVVSVNHPSGNFRLASGRKVIGRGSGTNLYTSVTVVR